MDQRVVNDQVAALRQRREQRGVGGEAGGEEERRLAAIVARRMRLERFMLGMVAAQKPRAARARRNAARGALRQRFRERVGTRKREIVVRGEIDPVARRKRAAAAVGGEHGEIGAVGGEGLPHHSPIRHCERSEAIQGGSPLLWIASSLRSSQ